MNMERLRRRAWLSWFAVGALLILCGILGVLQYRWIGEVSRAERERLRGNLQASLSRLSLDFNGEITAACAALISTSEPDYAARYAQWKESSQHSQLIRRIALAMPQGDTLALRSLDPDSGVFGPSEWPAAWNALRNRLESRLSREPLDPGPPGPPGEDEGLVFEVPRFGRPPGGPPTERFGRREVEWLIVELNLEYLRDVLLPEVLKRHLGSGGSLDYLVKVVTRTASPSVIYQSDPDPEGHIQTSADASVSLCEVQHEQMRRRPGPPGIRLGGRGGRGPGGDWGRWQMYVRHRAGSLEAVVSRTRFRNLAVTAGVLMLMLATVGALMRFTRRAQKLAELQMNFVAGVSHELRTPLTVIRTAAYNLRGKLAGNPSQVERYGALIQQESERLTGLVEQVLQFARAHSGRVIQEPEPLDVEAVIEESVESSKAVAEGSRCVIEKSIEPGLPLILGDPVALKHALLNLLNNAVKYGTEGSNWIGVFASRVADGDRPEVEIRVVDRGPGIPAEEQRQIFDPFFRGKWALRDQVHGSGLGLSLVKGIVEAHGGTITVHSVPAKGTEFVVRIPAAPREHQDEFAHSSG